MGLDSVVIVVVMVCAVTGRVDVSAIFPQIPLYCFFAQAVNAFTPSSSDMSAFLERHSYPFLAPLPTPRIPLEG